MAQGVTELVGRSCVPGSAPCCPHPAGIRFPASSLASPCFAGVKSWVPGEELGSSGGAWSGSDPCCEARARLWVAQHEQPFLLSLLLWPPLALAAVSASPGLGRASLSPLKRFPVAAEQAALSL